MNNFLNQVFWGNTILDFLICMGIIFLSVLIIRIIKFLIIKRLKKIAEKTKTKIDDLIIHSIEKYLIPLIYFLAVYFALGYLNIVLNVKKIIDSTIIVIVTYFAIQFFSSLIRYSIKFYWEKREHQSEFTSGLKGLSNFVTLIVWITGLIILLDNLGFNISAIVAGLGIGGIAIALAAQAVLGDFFSYFVILLDKPFLIGDFIVVDDKSGVIEKIGLKTTRMKSLTGEQIVFPNSDLTKARIHNYKKMNTRRIEFKFRVVYETSLENLKEIPIIVRRIIDGVEGVIFDRSHFKSYGDLGLNFETVYIVESPDYNLFMNIQQEINLKLFEEFKQHNIVFANPTHELFKYKD